MQECIQVIVCGRIGRRGCVQVFLGEGVGRSKTTEQEANIPESPSIGITDTAKYISPCQDIIRQQ